jgi:L-alanine-DL-glutamate epimerase-like enolase superfamily enzyme
MRIAKIETFPVLIPLRSERRMVSALGRHEVSAYVLVRVTTDDGLIGAGEATVTPRWSGETVWGAKAMIDHVLGPVLLGLDPVDTARIDAWMEAVVVDNWFAKAALEMACLDLAARARGVPLYEYLGGACRPLTVRSRFSLGAYDPKIAAERAAERVAAGFDTIKVKVGTVPGEDIERVRAVREAIGPEIVLTIDANGGWDLTRHVGVCADSPIVAFP